MRRPGAERHLLRDGLAGLRQIGHSRAHLRPDRIRQQDVGVEERPVAPSARNQLRDGTVAPAAAVPPEKSGWPKYITRSATHVGKQSTRAPKELFAISGIAPTSIVVRLRNGMGKNFCTGAAPSRKNVMEACGGSPPKTLLPSSGLSGRM